MNKLSIINCLRDSKKAHKALVNHVHALVEGLSMDEMLIPAHGQPSNSDRGYCSEHKALSELAVFHMMEESHTTYLAIRSYVKVRAQEEKPSLLGRLFGGNKVLELEQLVANHQISELVKQLKIQTRDIVDDIDSLIDRIIKMSDQELCILLTPNTKSTQASITDNRHAA